jgi:hypothetical protein
LKSIETVEIPEEYFAKHPPWKRHRPVVAAAVEVRRGTSGAGRKYLESRQLLQLPLQLPPLPVWTQPRKVSMQAMKW